MELQFANSKQKLELIDEIFSDKFNEALIHQVVVAYMAGDRAGTKAQKTRAEVRGGGAKPWRQKGTGRARAGTIRSPIWRTGGVTFAAKPRCYEQKVNKKMYKAALRSIVSELIRQDRLVLVDTFEVDVPKTKQFIAKLNEIKAEDKTLVVSTNINEATYLAARNLFEVELLDLSLDALNPLSLVSAKKVIVTLEAIKKIEELLK